VNTHLRGPDTRSSGAVFLLLLLIAIALRLPWFFQDVIDWDESGFILIGDALANGHLPYTLVWDNKPPLGFAFFAAMISVLPDSLAFIRLGGAILVALSAFLVFRISGRMVARQYALLSSTVFVVSVSSLISSGQAVMMEHVALAPMLGALALVDAKADVEKRAFAIGVLLGIATMVRTNLAYVLLSVLLLWPFASSHRSLREGVRSAVYVASGSMLVFGAIFAVYALGGHGKLLVDTAIRVALAYSDSNMGRLEAGRQMLRNILYLGGHGSAVEPLRFLAMFFWVAGLAGLALLGVMRRHRSLTSTFVLVFVFSTAFSIVSSGHAWGHYLIQVAPFFAIGAGILLSTVLPRMETRPVVILIFVLVVGITVSRGGFYKTLLETRARDGEIYQGVNFELARYLRTVSRPGDSLFLTDEILLYWLMDTYPLVPVAAFPANLWMEQAILKPLYGPGMTTYEILQEIVSRKPTRIILMQGRVGSTVARDGSRFFPQELLKGYYLESIVAGRLIYRRT